MFRSILLSTALTSLLLATPAFAKKDPTEVKMSCRIPTSQYQKGIAAAIFEEAGYSGDSIKKVSVKLSKQKGQGSDVDTFFADDYLKKLRISYKAGVVNLKKTPKVKFEKCSFDYDIKITVSGISGGKAVNKTSVIEGMTLTGFYQ